MMTRTQISLPSEDHRRARARAAEIGISLAEYLRRLVEKDLGVPRPGQGLQAIFDLGDSSGSDVGMQKDRYVADAVSSLNK